MGLIGGLIAAFAMAAWAFWRSEREANRTFAEQEREYEASLSEEEPSP